MKVIIVNDTSNIGHIGCDRVMFNLRHLCQQFELQVIDTVPVYKDWESHKSLSAKMLTCDLVLINGEGTIHHAAPAGKRLLELASYLKTRSIKSALINSTLQANPESWDSHLRAFDYIAVRETLSKRELDAKGIASVVVPDLSLYSCNYSIPTVPRNGIGFGCSVTDQVTDLLFQLCKNQCGEFLSIRYPVKQSHLTRIKTAVQTVRNRSFFFHLKKRAHKLKISLRNGRTSNTISNEQQWLSKLCSYEFFLTGRFHAVCMCILTETPFSAYPSNSHKIEGLLLDSGLDSRRLRPIADIPLNTTIDILPFSEAELNNLRLYKRNANKEIELMFSNLTRIIKDKDETK